MILYFSKGFISQKKFVDNAFVTEGVISATILDNGDFIKDFNIVDLDRCTKLLVEFKTVDKKIISFISDLGIGEISSLKPEVLYLLSSPKNAKVNDFMSLWGYIYGGIIIGFVLTLLGFVIRITK